MIYRIFTFFDTLFQEIFIYLNILILFPKITIQLWNIIDFKSELFPLHSPLLRESLLVSFPPLINMLKFSG